MRLSPDLDPLPGGGFATRERPALIDSVAIIGGGFSGALLAINLWRFGGPRALLIERRREVGKGVAYSACESEHVLNVRAGNMSAFPDDSGHFVRWLAARGAGDASSFVPRQVYGCYLGELLDEAAASAGERLRIVQGDVVAADHGDGRVMLRLGDGTVLSVEAAVLAVGNLPLHPPLPAADLPPSLCVAEPWGSDIAAGLAADDMVLLVGTGLTAVDAALTLDRAGFGGRILAMSRRGLAPRVHGAATPLVSRSLEQVPDRLSRLVHAVRSRTAEVGWRAAVDELRPVTQALWTRAPVAVRERFLRHLRPWWDVHRHRLAPEVAEKIEAMQTQGRLQFAAGRLVWFEPTGAYVHVRWRPRGSDVAKTIRVRRVINCTGPAGDLLKTDDPLLVGLREAGEIKADACRLGLDVDAQARVIRADGQPHERLHAIGPMTRGAFWEVTAVPDIRRQVWDLARRMSNAHWVGGEGL